MARCAASYGEVRLHGGICRDAGLRAVCESLLRKYQLEDALKLNHGSKVSETGGVLHVRLESEPGSVSTPAAGHVLPAAPKPKANRYAAGPVSASNKAIALKGKQSKATVAAAGNARHTGG